MSLGNFLRYLLKPELKKLIVFLVLLTPWIIDFKNLTPQFEFLNSYFSPLLSLYTMFFSILFILAYISGFVGILFVYLLQIFFFYYVSCLIITFWNWAFGYFGEKAWRYEIAIVLIIILAFFVFPVIRYNEVSASYITLEKNMRSNLTMNGLYGSPVLQELTIRNNFNSDITYRLPDVTVCLRNSSGNLPIVGVYVEYETQGGDPIDENLDAPQNKLVLKPNNETKIYLKTFLVLTYFAEDAGKKFNRENYDELLFLSNVGQNNADYCRSLKKIDINGAENVKIIMQ